MKRDLNYIKHVKKEIKTKEKEIHEGTLNQQRMKAFNEVILRANEAAYHHKKICKEAAEMEPGERLTNFAATGDGTYLGIGCNWDILTKRGLKAKKDIFGFFRR
jgi:transposase